MVQLQSDLKQIEAVGIQLVGISYDSVDVLASFADEKGITFPLLSDEGSKTIDAYGVRNMQVKAGSRQDGIPHPGTFLVDRAGIVRAKLPGTVRQRHPTSDLIAAAKKLD